MALGQQWSCSCDETHPCGHSHGNIRLGMFWGVVHWGPIWQWAQTLWITSSAPPQRGRVYFWSYKLVVWSSHQWIKMTDMTEQEKTQVLFHTMPEKQLILFASITVSNFFLTSKVALLEQELFFKRMPLVQWLWGFPLSSLRATTSLSQ